MNKTSHIGTILSTLSALTQQTCSQARMTVWPFFVVSACDPTSATQVMHRLFTVLKCKMWPRHWPPLHFNTSNALLVLKCKMWPRHWPPRPSKLYGIRQQQKRAKSRLPSQSQATLTWYLTLNHFQSLIHRAAMVCYTIRFLISTIQCKQMIRLVLNSK